MASFGVCYDELRELPGVQRIRGSQHEGQMLLMCLRVLHSLTRLHAPAEPACSAARLKVSRMSLLQAMRSKSVRTPSPFLPQSLLLVLLCASFPLSRQTLWVHCSL